MIWEDTVRHKTERMVVEKWGHIMPAKEGDLVTYCWILMGILLGLTFLNILFILLICPEFWVLYVQWIFESMPKALAINWEGFFFFPMKARPLLDAIVTGKPTQIT